MVYTLLQLELQMLHLCLLASPSFYHRLVFAVYPFFPWLQWCLFNILVQILIGVLQFPLFTIVIALCQHAKKLKEIKKLTVTRQFFVQSRCNSQIFSHTNTFHRKDMFIFVIQIRTIANLLYPSHTNFNLLILITFLICRSTSVFTTSTGETFKIRESLSCEILSKITIREGSSHKNFSKFEIFFQVP